MDRDAMVITLHLPALPHTLTTDYYSHCAYTGKVARFADLLYALGPEGRSRYRLVFYGREADGRALGWPVRGPDELVEVIGMEEWRRLMDRSRPPGNGPAFHGDWANVASPLYVEFNRRLAAAWRERVRLGERGDLVLLPFGRGHEQAAREAGIPGYQLVESGVGYPELVEGAWWRVYESYAWYHWHIGRAGRTGGSDWEWVVPNYYRLDDWPFRAEGDPDTVVYMGRLVDGKGLWIVVELANRRPDLRFVLAGQGDPAPYLEAGRHGNLEYRPPVIGRGRAELLGAARCVLVPTRYLEPFGGVAVEAQLCGTPVLTSDWGAFAETVRDGVSGYRCRTLGDWLEGLDAAADLDRRAVRAWAEARWTLEAVAPAYDAVFRAIDARWERGWYEEEGLWARRHWRERR